MSPVQFQVMSDLHLETPLTLPSYDHFKIKPRCHYLALLGDVGCVTDQRLFDFLEGQLNQFQIVFFLLGNHEPYGDTFSAARYGMESFANKMEQLHSISNIGRFVYLDQTRYDFDRDLTILGCTLFSAVLPEQSQPVQLFLSDFSNIMEWSIQKHCDAHESDLRWLNRQVNEMSQVEPNRTIIIFTHCSPTFLEAANNPEHQKDAAQVISGFVTDLSKETCWISPQVKLWAFGHTHFNCDFEDPKSGKRIVANQKGYGRSELVTFDPGKVVGIDIEHRSFTGVVGSALSKSNNDGGQEWMKYKTRKNRLGQCVMS